MKTVKVIFILSIAVLSHLSMAQVNGNGQLEARTFNFENITHLQLHIVVKAKLDLSLNDEFFIRTDSNIFDYIELKQKGGKLKIDQKEWIEPTSIEITAGLKGLQKLTNTAWGEINIINMEQPSFEANMNVGYLKVQGSSKSFKAEVGAGTIDTRDLITQVLEAQINQNGRIISDNAQRIELSGNGYGQFVYDGQDVLTWKDESSELTVSTLEEFYEQEANKEAVAYIDVKLKNNSGKRINIVFQGPIDAPFGYGIPIRARGSKKERLPVGTRIYKESFLGKGKLLLTITAENQGKTVSLFGE